MITEEQAGVAMEILMDRLLEMKAVDDGSDYYGDIDLLAKTIDGLDEMFIEQGYNL